MNFALFRIRKRHFFFMSETSEKIQINIFHYETYNTLRQFLSRRDPFMGRLVDLLGLVLC